MKFDKVLITGGSRGIGRALVEFYSNTCREIHIVSRNPLQFSNSRNLHFHKIDLSSVSDSEGFANSFLNKYGVPELVINNAGSGAFYEWEKFPEQEILNQINLLFMAPVILMRVFAPEMAKKEKGTFVNLSSLAVLYPLPYMPLYNAGKAALSAFTESMILEFGDFPKFVDFRMGDIRSEFNDCVSKRPPAEWKSSMKNAWNQIEKQLKSSPIPEKGAKQIADAVLRNESGVFYGGGFFQSKVAPIGHRFLTSKKLSILLRSIYKM